MGSHKMGNPYPMAVQRSLGLHRIVAGRSLDRRSGTHFEQTSLRPPQASTPRRNRRDGRPQAIRRLRPAATSDPTQRPGRLRGRRPPRPPEIANRMRLRPRIRSGRLYEQAESSSAKAFEELVAKPSFGLLLARSAENVAALARIGAELADLVWRNLASRAARTSPVSRDSCTGPRTSSSASCRRSSSCATSSAKRGRPRQSNGRDPERRRAGAGAALSALGRIVRSPRHAFEFTNVVLTTDDAVVGATPARRRLDASRHDPVSLSLRPQGVSGAAAARLRADQPAGDLRPAPGRLADRVSARRGLRRVPGRLGLARRGGRGHGARRLRLRRAALGDPRDAARPAARTSCR